MPAQALKLHPLPEAALFESVDGKSVTFEVPCSNHPSGWMRLVMTSQVAKPGGRLPIKTCERCRATLPVLAFVKHARPRGDYVVLMDDALCHRCRRPAPMPLHKVNGRLRMSLELRDETGHPITMWDRSTHRWRRPSALGLRLMTPTGSTLRLQPRSNRHRDALGRVYGREDCA